MLAADCQDKLFFYGHMNSFDGAIRVPQNTTVLTNPAARDFSMACSCHDEFAIGRHFWFPSSRSICSPPGFGRLTLYRQPAGTRPYDDQ